jgi:hypothetical protein
MFIYLCVAIVVPTFLNPLSDSREMHRPPQPPAAPLCAPHKHLVINEFVARVEKLLSEYEMLQNGTHPDIVNLKKRQDEEMHTRIQILETFKEEESVLLEQEHQCEIKCGQDEANDFAASCSSPKGSPITKH